MSESSVGEHLEKLAGGADITADIGTKLRLQIGGVTELWLRIDGVDARLSSKLVGMAPGPAEQ